MQVYGGWINYELQKAYIFVGLFLLYIFFVVEMI